MDLSGLLDLPAGWRRAGARALVFTNGCLELLPGEHVRLFDRAPATVLADVPAITAVLEDMGRHRC